MKPKMFDKVVMKDGKTAYIVEIFDSGKAYMVDVDLPNGETETKFAFPDDIKEVVQ